MDGVHYTFGVHCIVSITTIQLGLHHKVVARTKPGQETEATFKWLGAARSSKHLGCIDTLSCFGLKVELEVELL